MKPEQAPPPIARLELSGAQPCVAQPQGVALPLPDALLLAWLALEGPTPRERLASLLWPASDAEPARNALRQRLFRLRKLAGRDLVAGASVLALAPGVAHDLDDALTLLGDLAAPEGGELQQWLDARRAGRGAQQRARQEARIDALESAGDYAGALAAAQALLEADPLREDAHRRLMRLHYLRGDRAAAMLAFDRCEQLLKHEVGTTPSAETLALLDTVERAVPLPAPAPPRGPVPAALLRPPRMVGRDAELASARGALAQGSVVVLTGEAGMGKSRLLQVLAAERPTLLQSAGRPGDALVPYATLARALRQVLERDPTAADRTLQRQLAPLLPELAGQAAPAPAQPPVLQAVTKLLARASRSFDTLALDDLHFADEASIELLGALLGARRERDAPPLRWCLGLRPALPDTPLHALVRSLTASGPVQEVTLAPLTEVQLAELVDSLALPGLRGAGVAPLLLARTGGNPLFALETLKLAWAEGAFAEGRGGDAALAEGLPRPQSLAQLIGQQLARLSPPALALARVAAVAGVDFSIPLAESLLGRSALDLADPWAELEAQQVLRGEAFAHDLIHDAVLQALPAAISRHLHAQAAAWLERQEAEPARVAAHWESAGQRAKALPALRAAAERAHRALRENERIAFLLHAADIAEGEDRRDDAFTLVRQAVEAHMNTIRQTEGVPLLDRLDRLAHSPAQAARAAGDRAWYSAVLGDLPRAVTLGEQALALAQPLGDEAVIAPIRQRLGTALGLTGRFDAALAHMRAAEAWMTQHAPPDERVEFHGNLAVVLNSLGRPDDAKPYHRRALEDAYAQGDQAHIATLLANFAAGCLDGGDVALALEQAAQAQRIVTHFEMAGSSAGFVATLLAQCERALGRYAAALQWCERAKVLLAECAPARVPVAQMHHAHVWLDLAQHARALQLLDGDALAAARKLPPRFAVRWLVLLARTRRRVGQDAAALLDEALDIAPASGWPELRLIARIERCVALDAGAALAELEDVAAAAAASTLRGAELAAELHACTRAAKAGAAHARRHARRAIELSAAAHAMQTDPAARWLWPAQALAAAGDAAAAATLVREGAAWLRTTAAVQVPPEFASSFVEQHPLHRELLAWEARLR